MNVFRKATLATALVATTLASASPAMARDNWGHRRGGGGDDAAIAIGAGIVGLAIGAIVASSSKKRDRYDDRYYQGRRYNDRYNRDGWSYRDGGYYDRHGRRYNRDEWRRDYGDRYDGNRYENRDEGRYGSDDDRRRGYDRGDDYERRGY